MRVDMLAAMFSGLGLLFFLKAESKSEWVYVSIMMFVLAGFTRQSSIALPMACFVMAVFRRPGMAIRFAGGIGCGAAIGFVVLNWITGGSFYQHVIVANASHEFSWSRAVEWIVGLFRLYPLFFSIAFIGAVMALRDFGRSLAAQREDPTPIVISKGDASWGKPLLGWAWLFAFAVSLTIGKTASNINYFIDFMMVTAILLGVSTASVWGKFQKTNPARFGRVGTTTAIVVAIILVWLQVSSTSGLAQRMNGYARTLPGGRVRLETREVVARIEFAAGDVLSTDHTLLALAGKRIFFETRDMRRFYDNGLVDPAPMVEMVHETRFPLIVVRNRTHSDLAGTNPGRSRYVPEMTEQIKRNYELVWKGESYFIYERKRDSARKRFAQ